MIDDRKQPLTIEDLLRLKRAERPSPEFWSQFERELREKQLAAIVEKRPWWCAIPGLYVFVARHRLSLAASASAVAICLVGFHAYEATASGAVVPASGVPDSVASVPVAAPRLLAAADEYAARQFNQARPAAASAPASGESGRNERPVASLAALSVQSLPAIPLLGDLPQNTATERFDAISRSLAGDLATGGTSMAEGARSLLVGVRDFGSRAIPSRASVAEPLAQMPSPSAERRSRLLAEAFPAMAGPADMASAPSERVLGRLSDDRLYASGGRYDVATERELNSIKFSIRF